MDGDLSQEYIYIYLHYLFFPQEKQTTGYATTIDMHVVWEVWEILATLNEWSIYIALYCLLKLCFKLVQRHFYQSWLLERNSADAGHWWTLRICLFELLHQNWSVVYNDFYNAFLEHDSKITIYFPFVIKNAAQIFCLTFSFLFHECKSNNIGLEQHESKEVMPKCQFYVWEFSQVFVYGKAFEMVRWAICNTAWGPD